MTDSSAVTAASETAASETAASETAASETAAALRARGDLSMFEALLAKREVKRANEAIEKHEADNPRSLRRQLLSTSVRLSRTMAPALHAMADDCIEKLAMDTPLELFVFQSAQYNAMCFKPEDGRLFVMFASSLLEAFEDNELKFVLGHELGHHVYRHHDVPIGYMLKGPRRPGPRLALELFTWSRYAEISADRAGAHCAQDFEAVARSLFKLSSGLRGDTVSFSLDDFLAQVDEMQVHDAEPGAGAPQADWFSTHPFSPLRVRALKSFDESHFARDDGMDSDALEADVRQLMGLMEPSYLEGRTSVSEAMRRLLFSGALLVADAHDGISEAEIAVFEKFFGSGTYSDDLDLDALADGLDERMAQVKSQATRAQCQQVVRDLCLVALAENHTAPAERVVLDRVATALGVPTAFVDATLEAELEPD